jgi:tetratricopeptide (TPR) repeat protein
MKKIVLLAIMAAFFSIAEAQLKTPAPSPSQTVKQEFALSSIELSYSRPGMKGRKIFGDLVPYGKVWRTGANSATTITFGEDVIIAGTKVPAGKYGLLTIPEKKNWTIIISKQTDVTNPNSHKAESDLVRITAPVKKMKDAQENFSIGFQDVKPSSVNVVMSWDKSSVSFPITADVDTKVMASINTAMKSDKPPYFQAALYYMENGKDLNQALTWFNKAVEENPKAFWIQHQWANCLAKLGKKEEARAAATRSKELAVEAKNDDYVKLNDKLLADLK